MATVKVAYLVNQYPKVSHTFIRREIAALMDEGIEVLRFSIRPTSERLVDARDQAEQAQTSVLLSRPKRTLVVALGLMLLRRPWRFLRALRMTLRWARRSDRGMPRHLAYLAEACLLSRCLLRDEIHHVHAHFGTNSASVALLARELVGVTFSLTVHGPEEFDKATQWALGEKIERSAFVVAVSHFGRSQLLRQCVHSSWPKIHVVHCGVDGDFLDAPVCPLPEARRLLSVGRLSEQKGQLLLIEALGRLRREGCRLMLDLVGDGELRAEIEHAIAWHGLADSVRITGWADGATVRRAIDACSAFVLPSLAEGLPVVIMEAMARARPVLSTYVAGIPELVLPGENGWLVAAGSVEDLARGLRDVMVTPAARLAQMGENGRRRVAEHHDTRRIAVELAALIRAAETATHSLDADGVPVLDADCVSED